MQIQNKIVINKNQFTAKTTKPYSKPLTQGASSHSKIPASLYQATFCGRGLNTLTLKEINSYFKNIYSSLPGFQECKDSLGLYQLNEFYCEKMNNIIRGKTPDLWGDIKGDSDLRHFYRAVHKSILNIDKLMENSLTPCKLTIFRGIRESGFFRIKGFGDYFTDKGFMSTTYSKEQAFRHGDYWIAEIKLPKGTKAIDMNAAMPDSRYKNEKELLLARGSRLKILNADQYNMKIDLELVSQEKPSVIKLP